MVTSGVRDAFEKLIAGVLLTDLRVPGAMASAGVAAGRQAEDALPPPAEPPLPETKPLPPSQPPPPVAAPQPQQSPAPRPQSPAGVKEEENYSFLPLVHNIIKW